MALDARGQGGHAEHMLETMTTVLKRLQDEGFVDDLIVEDGHLRAATSERRFEAADLVSAEVVRFEGESNPDDEAIVFALQTTDGEKIGTYTVPYGAMMTGDDVAVVRHLSRARA